MNFGITSYVCVIQVDGVVIFVTFKNELSPTTVANDVNVVCEICSLNSGVIPILSVIILAVVNYKYLIINQINGRTNKQHDAPYNIRNA